MNASIDSGGAVDELPSVRFVDRFQHGEDVFYAEQEEHLVHLYRVTGEVEAARALMTHDAAIHNGSIVSAEYESRYHTIDLYHGYGGRLASIRADKFLDEPAVTLEEVDRYA